MRSAPGCTATRRATAEPSWADSSELPIYTVEHCLPAVLYPEQLGKRDAF